eukprot:CAMPEP_0201592462 /NCGR_PEP_ID=MMETSP0190_2-20130828/190353_1 /ASSEMBLY_ACC=CAM_ASM_000263 /TAXON_ID=37353 /ORGANISM="Rosalina sp." /LENGTH=70 /DNA_ID=CAMNT_0048051249 /DNA_START=766 /DNA_END=978 /DNA_ORIENTATION=-
MHLIGIEKEDINESMDNNQDVKIDIGMDDTEKVSMTNITISTTTNTDDSSDIKINIENEIKRNLNGNEAE